MTVIAIPLFVIALNPWIAPTKAYAEWDVSDTQVLAFGLSHIEEAIKNIDCRR